MEFIENLYFNIIDILVFTIILSSCIVATFRGFIKELFSIFSWVLSLIIAFHFYEKFKLQLLEYVSQKLIVDFIAFGFPFLSTLIISHILSNWLSPKFNMTGVIVIDKICGFAFGAFRGFLMIILFYLGFLYLIGKERTIPNTLLESFSYKYINFSAEMIVEIFNKNSEIMDDKEIKDL